ncbi:putative winged helix-turn-helix DNA-binding domain, toll-like receptor [Rosa chinensis]|uniref:ADP-ribosyl cyclase/cyclic ADP-ribose hydrolase n=1 Tax=Rosa chinensis TaxID=74649 RepID=A0A2P6RE43_ROSCH|nr:TMV resistance protein N [Rosa chinensis]XP_024186940.1 TMV resistance protein N [Rosa chinensis]XP_040372653.1 TMV resistance protein N [Rosa chinensis]PRQ44688.1 putative winged helix-turn-helix DNA-binding domain, toll-like receptor [Rosa chinensis]
MALSTHRASPSLAWDESPPHWKFDVFLSFRGEDTRWGFISHLYRELEFWQAFKIFKDDRELEIGASISPELLSAIEQSHLAIVVLSPNYASSTWCLDELSKIIESMEKGKKRILPVFFNVDPSDVRHQRSSFADAFAKHEVKFSDQIEKVERWREALRKVANLSGWDAKNYKCERELIEVIVKRVWEKVRPTIILSDSEEKLVGIDFRLRQMRLLLAPEEKDVRFIGIWGMGGVGKTTLARLVYEKISHHFDVAEFLFDHGPLINLQNQVLSQILKENISPVWDEYKGTIFIRKCLSNKKVLLVFDDVDSCDHLEKLAGHKSWFGEGSRIIVTTRDKRLLTERRIELSFELVRLNDNDALELFSHKAFEKDQPEEGFLELSKCFVDYVEGLPLALKILGSSLYKRDLEAWKSALDKLKKGCDAKVFNSLKISYDALDYMEKSIFLDIAFFYTGVKKGRVIESLESCDLSGHYGIELLIEKSLITIDQHNNVRMHGLVQEMAWEIVRQESREEPGLRSRLCHRNDIFHVFMRNTGTEAIKGIRLCLPRLEEADSSWNCECFSKMPKLMFLEFHNLIISSGPKSLPNSLIILNWNRYPSKSLPAGFRPNILAELKMQENNLVRLWDGRQDLPNLKYMDLKWSKSLKETPDFTGIPNLEELDLACCDGLVKVHPSIAVNKKLKQLTLYGCKNVKVFPSKIEMDSLEFLSLEDCSKVKIPEFGEGMKNLSLVYASGTASEELPSSIEHLVGLTCLFINDSKSLQSLPGTAIFKLKSLRELGMSGCPKLKKLVENTGETKDKPPALRQIFGGSSMKRKLYMGFTGLFKKKGPEPVCLALPSPGALSSLQGLFLDYCNLCQGGIPDDIGYCLPSLEWLHLSGNNFVSLPPSIKCLSKLRFLNLKRCKRLQQLPDLPSNEELSVFADDCDSLKMLSKPSQQGRFTELVSFRLTTVNCFGLIDNEGLNNGIFSMLSRLAAQGISPSSLSLSGDVFRPPFDIVSPGSKISEWFDIQSEGDSLTVELPPDRESEWMGIVFCVVFANQKDQFDYFQIECSSPGIRREYSVPMEKPGIRRDHLWVSFMPRGQIQDTTSCSIRFSFVAHFYTISGCTPSSNCVKRCGARLLYEQDLKNLLDGKTNILKRSREYCDSEEAEPGEGPSAIAIGSSNKESVFKRLKA